MFGRTKKTPVIAPIRRGPVINAIKAHMDFESAIDRDLEGPEFERIKRKFDQATQGLTKAEVQRMYEAQDRHRY